MDDLVDLRRDEKRDTVGGEEEGRRDCGVDHKSRDESYSEEALACIGLQAPNEREQCKIGTLFHVMDEAPALADLDLGDLVTE